MQRKRYSHKISWPLIVLLLLVVVAFWQQQAIRDWVRLRDYTPPAAIAQLSDDINLTDEGRKLFYVNHPLLQDRAAFKSSCSSRGEETIILGCYHPIDRGIFLFDVTDERLDGVDQVTAAHEMLHAAYDRLHGKEQKRIDKLLQDYYAEGKLDERVAAIIEAYKKSEPNDVINEMHSVFATEVAELPAELETYYQQYFVERAKVVKYAEAYQAEFTSRQNQVTDADKRLEALKQQISDQSASLDMQEAQIKTLRSRMDADRSSGNVTAYNANVPVFNARIDAYNNLIVTAKATIRTYNDLVAERNRLALQVADLAHSIDSSFEPIEQ